MGIVVLVYASAKAIKVMERLDTSFETKIVLNDILETDIFTFEEMKANFAIGFYQYETNMSREEILDYVDVQGFFVRKHAFMYGYYWLVLKSNLNQDSIWNSKIRYQRTSWKYWFY